MGVMVAARAEDSVPAAAPTLAPVVVTATRVLESSADLPVSVDRVDARRIEDGRLQVNLSESLAEVPGVVAQNRQNYAQDLQISVRGFGARSAFGLRGVRLYADGIPGTMPDGQGQFSHFDLGSAGRIEVLRGPFSALYGNSSGGVIAIFTDDAPPAFAVSADASGGSFGTERLAARVGDRVGALGYVVDVSHFDTDGYRQHSAAERDLLNTRLTIDLGEGASLAVVANAVSTPAVQDPLGLTRAQLAADPSQAGTNAIAYDTRKQLSQQQAGVSYSRPLGDWRLELSGYGGSRHTTQYQAILAATEARFATHPGGVVDLERGYGGGDAHATWLGGAARAFELTVGIGADLLGEARRGYLNYTGQRLGVEGALRRDESNRVDDLDEYLQASWRPASRLRLSAGVRHSEIDVRSDNHLAGAGNPAQTSVSYSATNPVAGVSWRVAEGADLYAAYGRGFETPTLNDLAYRSTDGSVTGLNTALRPAHSDNYETGVKFAGPRWRATLAGFRIETRDELAVASSAGGRSVYRNIDRTLRRGAEASLGASFGSDWTMQLAYTYLQATVETPYRTCVGAPCLPFDVPAGSRLPAVPRSTLYAALDWSAPWPGLHAGIESIGRSAVFVDDRNTDAAAAYWVFNAHLTLRQSRGDWRLEESLRVDNALARRYVGSVIVNDSNGRFFEPEPGRTGYLLLRVRFR